MNQTASTGPNLMRIIKNSSLSFPPRFGRDFVKKDPGAGGTRTEGRELCRSLDLDQTAASPCSSVRMRRTSSSGSTKILPSPILPVLAPAAMAAMADSELVRDGDPRPHLGPGSRPLIHCRDRSRCGPSEAAKPLDLGHGHTVDPDLVEGFPNLVRSLNGLMMAMMSFM